MDTGDAARITSNVMLCGVVRTTLLLVYAEDARCRRVEDAGPGLRLRGQFPETFIKGLLGLFSIIMFSSVYFAFASKFDSSWSGFSIGRCSGSKSAVASSYYALSRLAMQLQTAACYRPYFVDDLLFRPVNTMS